MIGAGEPEVCHHFARDPRAYAAFRPHYPAELFDWLAGLVARHDLAWDCATGTGQAAVGLAGRFTRIVATDLSAEQVSAAEPDPRIEYRVAPAHASGLAPGTVALVTVAQALHWIEPESFYREARRVAAPGAAIAAWTYGSPEVEPEVDRVLQQFYRETVGPFWPPERRHVETGYSELAFPFVRIPAPELAIEAGLTLPAMLGYVGTWSATRRYVETRGEDPVPALGKALAQHWGPPDAVRAVRWPLAVLAGRLG
jgi:hypothetical protein